MFALPSLRRILSLDAARTVNSLSITRGLSSQQSLISEISDNAKQAIERIVDQERALAPKFVNVLMKSGNDKQKVEKHIAYGLQLIHKRTRQNPEILFRKAIDLISPVFECGSYRRGAKTIRVPLPLNERLSTRYALSWLRESLRKKDPKNTPLEERFANEILKILEGTSPILQKKAQLHKEAVVNRSFVNMRWAIGGQPSTR
jgi:small subunit ribosomal protein S7